jgi:hypothetical protein
MHSISSSFVLKLMVTVGTEPRALRLLGHYADEGIFHDLEFSETKALQHSVVTLAEYSGV